MKNAELIFEKYNPKDKVVRCPNGRAKMRKPLDKYARAAVNLYGIISLSEFVDIFNSQNEDKTTTEEVYTILLPNVIKNRWYGFYKNFIVHYLILSNFDWVDYLLHTQKDKPRFIPIKSEFLKYESELYEYNVYWSKIHSFMLKTFGYNRITSEAFYVIKNMLNDDWFQELGKVLETYDLKFKDEKETVEFFKLVNIAKNNTRIWENKGYTPIELRKILSNKKEVKINKSKKTGPNSPCPCGSGKKYKHCCSLIENSINSHLSFNDRKFFYETWLKLLDFVNKKLKVIDYSFDYKYPGKYNEELIIQIRDKLWENPKLISEYINNNELSVEEVELLQSWEKYHLNGDFIIVKYEAEYALFMQISSEKSGKLFAVKGITDSLRDTIPKELPIHLKTVLIPFKNTIIYDGLMYLSSISFASGAKKMIQDFYDNSFKQFGITHDLMN